MKHLSFPDQLVFLRKKYHLPQEVLARALGVKNPQTISHWETGRSMPSIPIQRLIMLLTEMRPSEGEEILNRLDRLGRQTPNHKTHFGADAL